MRLCKHGKSALLYCFSRTWFLVICSPGNIQQVSFDEKWKPQLYLACVAGVQRWGKGERELPFYELPHKALTGKRFSWIIDDHWRQRLFVLKTLPTNRDRYKYLHVKYLHVAELPVALERNTVTGLWTVFKALNVEVTNEYVNVFILVSDIVSMVSRH